MTFFSRQSHVSRFAGNRSGLAALEFAFIAPIIIFIGMLSITNGFKLLERQRLDSAVASTVYFLSDKVMTGDYRGFQPDRVGTQNGQDILEDGDYIATARLVLQDAHKSGATLTITELDVFCGCPQYASGTVYGFDPSQPFYERHAVETRQDSTRVCTATCSDNSLARLLAEIDVQAASSDLFGQSYTLEKQMVARLK